MGGEEKNQAPREIRLRDSDRRTLGTVSMLGSLATILVALLSYNLNYSNTSDGKIGQSEARVSKTIDSVKSDLKESISSVKSECQTDLKKLQESFERESENTEKRFASAISSMGRRIDKLADDVEHLQILFGKKRR